MGFYFLSWGFSKGIIVTVTSPFVHPSPKNIELAHIGEGRTVGSYQIIGYEVRGISSD